LALGDCYLLVGIDKQIRQILINMKCEYEADLPLMALYALLATTFAAANLAQASGWVHLIYFLLTGILWIIPAMLLIKWMLKPDKS